MSCMRSDTASHPAKAPGTPRAADTFLSDLTNAVSAFSRREAERNLFSLVRAHHAKVALVQHLSLPELTGKYHAGYYANQEVAREEKVSYVDDADELRAQLKSGNSPFYQGDFLHLNKSGQAILAHTLERAVELALQNK